MWQNQCEKSIGATIRIGQEIRCLLYADFFKKLVSMISQSAKDTENKQKIWICIQAFLMSLVCNSNMTPAVNVNIVGKLN